MINRFVSFDYYGTIAYPREFFNEGYHRTLAQEPFNLKNAWMTDDENYYQQPGNWYVIKEVAKVFGVWKTEQEWKEKFEPKKEEILKNYERNILDVLHEADKIEPLPGVIKLLDRLAELGYPTGLHTGESKLSTVIAFIDKTGLSKYFPEDSMTFAGEGKTTKDFILNIISKAEKRYRTLFPYFEKIFIIDDSRHRVETVGEVRQGLYRSSERSKTVLITIKPQTGDEKDYYVGLADYDININDLSDTKQILKLLTQ